MRKTLSTAVLAFGLVAVPALPALACGGLIGPRGAVNLTRTTTLAAHHNGVEHYVTAFNYAGGGGEFGSIVPLPGMPSKVERGGDWTLQRLLQETEPVVSAGSVAAASGDSSERAAAKEVYRTKIDALDITVLKGGGRSVGIWASEHGFRLPPDAPEVLDFYGDRSPYFMAAVFDAEAAEERGQQIGDGTPIHVTIPLRSPWVPLRILGLGKQASERVDADVYLLTDRIPNLLPSGSLAGYRIERQVPASEQLLADLRSDKGMGWMPSSGMILTHLEVDAEAPKLRYDLAINTAGGTPSRSRAGLPPLPTPPPPPPTVEPTIAPTPPPTAEPTDAVLALPEPVEPTSSSWPLVTTAILVPIAGLAAALWLKRRTNPTS
jgi:hypothetical protein